MKLFLICSSNSRRGLKFSVGVWRDHITPSRKIKSAKSVLITPERPSCPSNTADLPAGSLLPSIPNKPENRRSSDPIRQKIKKKTTPFSNAVPNQKKDGQQESAGAIRTKQQESAKRQQVPEQ